MKLMWFHLMPYTELPEDFRDKNPSVWVEPSSAGSWSYRANS
jgi:hypothetical protein